MLGEGQGIGFLKETTPNPLSVGCSLPINVRGRAGEGVFKDNFSISIKDLKA